MGCSCFCILSLLFGTIHFSSISHPHYRLAPIPCFFTVVSALLSHLSMSYLLFMPSLSFRGFVYCRNEELEAGWVVHSKCYLLHRPASFDTKSHQLCQVIDPYTLQVSSNIHPRFRNLFNILAVKKKKTKRFNKDKPLCDYMCSSCFT